VSLAELRREVRAAANPEAAEKSKRFFKTGPGQYSEGDIFLGIRVPVLRQIAKQFKQLSTASLFKLLQSKYHEERLLALFMLVAKFEKSENEERKNIYELYLQNTEKINNWDLVDSSAHQIVGGQLFERSRKPLLKLAKSKCLWRRRIAIIATFHFIRRDDFETTLEIAELLLQDKEDLIHKAVGWMLREVGERDHSLEVSFLEIYADTMPRTMLRYAIEKFPEIQRRRFLGK
jgi:3-methyladenine DNA glycosylase AlkD